LRYRRFRLLVSLAGAAVLASAVVTGFIEVFSARVNPAFLA
jgi:hypothetical protein